MNPSSADTLLEPHNQPAIPLTDPPPPRVPRKARPIAPSASSEVGHSANIAYVANSQQGPLPDHRCVAGTCYPVLIRVSGPSSPFVPFSFHEPTVPEGWNLVGWTLLASVQIPKLGRLASTSFRIWYDLPGTTRCFDLSFV
jgi:hypothetical protein